MIYATAPLAVVAVIGLLCLNFKIGFMVGDLTRHTGFDAGFYMMTLFGLTALEISAAVFLIDWFAA